MITSTLLILLSLFLSMSSTTQKIPKVLSDSLSSELSQREREIIAEINLARTNPAAYAAHLERYRSYYRGLVIEFPDGFRLTTNEGIAAVNEAINFLRAAKPRAALGLRQGTIQAARDHLKDMERTGKTGHRGSDGSIPEDRLSRYGRWSGSVGEDIVYESRDPRDSVIGLIIDDGAKKRGHRENIFKRTFTVIGIAEGKPAKSGALCVITFAEGFNDKAAAPGAKATKTPEAREY